MKLSNKQAIPLLLLLLSLFSWFLHQRSITLFPAFMHSWTQSDRYALALGFLNNGFDFFHPATFNLGTPDGITRVDFPINEYIVALLMKILGTTAPVIFRLYTLCFSFIGMIFLYLFTKKITSSEVKSWLIVFFVFLSPMYVYYQDGFIPTIPALSCAVIGYYYFFSYRENENVKSLRLSILFLTLAALIRMPFIIFLLATLVHQMFLGYTTKQFKKTEWMAYACGFGVYVFYFFYNLHLYRMYGSIFLDHLMPAGGIKELKKIVVEMYNHWGLHYFSVWQYVLLFLGIIVLMVTFIKGKSIAEKNKKYWFHLLIITCGSIVYFLFMARQYYAHDYYFLDSLFIPIVLFLILAINTLNFENYFYRDLLNVGYFSMVILFLLEAKKIQAERYSAEPWDRTEITRQNFMDTYKFLDEKGIAKDAKILVIDAYTANAPLILMNRKGYTVMSTTYKNISTSLFWAGWDYVAIQDVYLVSDVIKNYPLITSMLERIGGTGKVSFYKRSEKYKTKTLKDFLAITEENTLYNVNLSFDIPNSDVHIIGTENTSNKFFYTSPNSAMLNEDIEYGAVLKLKAHELNRTDNLKVLINAAMLCDQNLKDIQWVCAVSNSVGTLFYQNFTLSDYFKSSDKWQQMEFQFVLPPFKTADDELKVYLWNPAKATMYYDNLGITVYK